MPRDLPLCNGTLLVNFDLEYRVRDVFYPHVGQENHAGGHLFRLGFWADGAFSWMGADWHPEMRYVSESLLSAVRAKSEALGLERELQQLLFTSEDAKEGLAAYVEKRAANFKGK